VVEQIVDSPADDTAGARVVARLQGAPAPAWHLRPLWPAPAAAAVLLLALVAIGRGALTPSNATDAASDPAPPVAAAHPSEPSAPSPSGADGLAPAAEQPVMARQLAPIARAPAGRGRARPRMRELPPAVDDPSTVPLLELAGALRLEGLDEAVGAGSGPTPLSADALALETLEPPAVAPRQDE
jgi:hypothetical protein